MVTKGIDCLLLLLKYQEQGDGNEKLCLQRLP